MCGIAGAYNPTNNLVPKDLVKQMGSLLTHRGPDNFGFCERDSVAMAHNRLSLLDLSVAANQPFENRRYMLSYNGEIYNYKHVRERLAREHNLEFRTTSDTEVLF